MDESVINIVIPAYNEENYVFDLIQEIVDVKPNLSLDLRIIIVDDCSTDKTPEEISRAIITFNEIEIISIRNDVNSGKGYCLKVGFKHAKKGIIIIQDADLEYSPSEYNKLITPIINNKTDVVYGSRFQGSEPKRVLYYTHYIANRWLTTLSNIFTGLNLSDMETCYKAFRTELLEGIDIKERQFGFEPEITAKLSRVKGVRFVEVGISYFGRTYSEGKKIRFNDSIRAIWCILKYNIWARK